MERLAEITERFTGADISSVCIKAGILALREDSKARQITMEHLLRATKDTTPSVTEEMERDYEKIVQTMKQEAMRIGFRPFRPA
ncbi:MAG: hypothetical protein HYV61_12685 [Candidatus Rokubacteria bacterium]|nr:hypothetical protein [Candidatus Rokubacteria bacterium]MBI2878747.1 hypothetical protein [Candidatus Rokubacteria bacterium]